MSTAPETTGKELEELLSIPLAERIEAVANDVSSRRDRFRSIDAHELAEALGIFDAWKPGSDWHFQTHVEKMTLEEYADLTSPASEIVYFIQERVSVERFQEILEITEKWGDDESGDFSFLTSEERLLIEDYINEKNLESTIMNGMGGLGYRTITSKSGVELTFEGEIEDDGECIRLLTPYEIRDGGGTDLSNSVVDY